MSYLESSRFLSNELTQEHRLPANIPSHALDDSATGRAHLGRGRLSLITKRESGTKAKDSLALRYVTTGGAFSGKDRFRTVSRKQFSPGGPVSYSLSTSGVCSASK